MIDIHSHLLPGLDDGPNDMEESLNMARIYEQAGFSHVVATPHWIHGTSWMPDPQEIREKAKALNQAIAEQGMHLGVMLGMEIGLTPEIPALLDEGRLLPLACGRYVLIEPPFQRLPQGFEQIFFELSTRRYTVLLAHPERCVQLMDQPQMFPELVASGVYLQANWGSFLGLYGREVLNTVCHLAAKGHIHCLATDSHGPQSRHVGQVREAAAKVEELVGTKNLHILARENPDRAARGEPLVAVTDLPVEYRALKKRRRFRSSHKPRALR